METEAESLILASCRRHHPDGVDNETLKNEVKHKLSIQEQADAINKLLQSSRIELFSLGDRLVYKLFNREQAAKLKGLTPDEVRVYQTIERTANSGIWTRDLRYQIKLAQPVLNKILKNLENRQLVKTFRPVDSKTRKMYILYSLKPAEHLTGGAWYTGTEKDTEFIEVLREVCYKKITLSGTSSLSEIFTFIKDKRLSREDLRDENVKSVLDTLVYEGRIDEIDVGDGRVHYRPALLTLPVSSPLTSVPCGVCPVFNECHPGGVVSPEGCQYMKRWLDF